MTQCFAKFIIIQRILTKYQVVILKRAQADPKIFILLIAINFPLEIDVVYLSGPYSLQTLIGIVMF